jgi:hypothetical protein
VSAARKPTFQPFEWAVLVNGIGGRLFQVETTTWTEGGTERVHEHYIQPGDTKSRYELYGAGDPGSHVCNLIKVPDKATAEAVVELLGEVYDAGDRIYRKAKMDRDMAVGHAAELIQAML